MSLSVASRSSRVRTWYSYGFWTPGFKCALPSASNSIGRFSKHMIGISSSRGRSLRRVRDLYDLREVVVGAQKRCHKTVQPGINRHDFAVEVAGIVANLHQSARKFLQMVGAPLQCHVDTNEVVGDDQDNREQEHERDNCKKFGHDATS